MSVLIEGMTMPANCQECIALKIGDICFCGKKVATEEWNGTNRPDWCPLIECNECKDAVSRKAVKELIQNDFPQRGNQEMAF